MSFPDPRENPELVGQDAAETAMGEAMQSGRLHHGWLLTGPEGVGKATLAFRFARRLLAGLAEAGQGLALPETHLTFRRVAAGTHADLLTIQREWDDKRKRMRGEIVVDDVRKIAEFLRLTPAEGGWRVVIVDEAEEMNRNAANALLKLLEEPPPRAILLLVCSAPGRLLPTIRSRCRRLALDRLDDATLSDLLARHLPEIAASDRARLVALADGSPGRAAKLAAENGVKLAGLVDDLLGALPAMPPGAGQSIADALGPEGFSTFMDLLRARLSDIVRGAARGSDALGARLATQRPLEAWVDVWQALTRLQSDTERFNMDKRQAVLIGLGLLRG